jgi:chemotaxis family two-component system response regulator Rcp1
MNERGVGRPIEILLVEDNPGDARLAIEAFKDARTSNNLSVVGNGEVALEFLHRQPPHQNAPRPDLILLDLNLPRKSGRELLHDIKSDPDLHRIPVVVLTTSRAEEDVAKAYDLNANCYITKPVDLDEFLDVVQAIENFWLTVARLP